MRSAVIGFVAGLWWLQQQAALPAQSVMLLVIGSAIAFAFFASKSKRTVVRSCMLLGFGVLLGFAWGALFAQRYLAHELPGEWEGRDITVVGTIDSLPFRFDRGVRFHFLVEQVLPVGDTLPPVPSKLALSWYSAFSSEEENAVGNVQPGERWRLTVRLKKPHGNANPHGFDYEVWLLEQNLRATGYVRPDEKSPLANRRLDDFVFGFGHVVERCRGWLRDRILATLPDHKYAGVIVALVVGDQRAIDQSDWKVFNRTGISHLISISGLHITMIAGLFAGLVFQLWRRSFFTKAKLPVVLPAQKAAALAGAGAALLYVLLAGFGVPAQRTLYMLSVVAAAIWFGRIASVSHVLCAALGIVTLLDPWSVLWPGFWLSFGAVAIILYATVGRAQLHATDSLPQRERWKGVARSAAQTQYAVTVGLVPLTMLLFGQASLVSPIANAVAIPLVSFVVTPVSLAGSILPAPVSAWLLEFAHFLIESLALGLGWLSDLPAAAWSAPIPAPWIFVAAFCGTLWLLAPRGWPLRWIGLAGWLPLVLNAPAHPDEGEMWVTAFDVGQGMALLVETRQHRLLYDTGPAYSPESDGGNRVILPYLKARGIASLDGVIVSHNDNDHSGGALSIFDEIGIDWVASSLSPESAIVKAAPAHRRCRAGQSWSWDGIRFEMLHPGAASYESAKWKPNARSCTLKITVGAQSILLAGDIEAVQEKELLESDRDKLRSTVLLAPHHGSGTSSSKPFLEAVEPKFALFQVGYHNRYRHPKPEVFERYRSLGIERLRSDEAGAVTLRFGQGLRLETYRTEHARYWHGH
ncbi:MAG TPA: DNA internalization-related competence protein ComEC/Rec2 [Burkholderiaceae bacterium]|nr:DNA internalization-related competence protein ComEC/Rec2 [Burkholderiaceae bacterium]